MPILFLGPTAPGQQQTAATNMSQQPGMRPQFPPQINKQQGQANLPQVPMPVSQTQMQPQQVYGYDRSGLTKQQILSQHLLAQQQQQQQQLPTQSLMTQQALNVASQNQGAHLQMTQSQSHIPPNKVASPMAQQQVVHPGLLYKFYVNSVKLCDENKLLIESNSVQVLKGTMDSISRSRS